MNAHILVSLYSRNVQPGLVLLSLLLFPGLFRLHLPERALFHHRQTWNKHQKDRLHHHPLADPCLYSPLTTAMLPTVVFKKVVWSKSLPRMNQKWASIQYSRLYSYDCLSIPEGGNPKARSKRPSSGCGSLWTHIASWQMRGRFDSPSILSLVTWPLSQWKRKESEVFYSQHYYHAYQVVILMWVEGWTSSWIEVSTTCAVLRKTISASCLCALYERSHSRPMVSMEPHKTSTSIASKHLLLYFQTSLRIYSSVLPLLISGLLV